MADLKPHRGRGGPAGSLQLKDKARKYNESSLSQGYGKRGSSAYITQRLRGVRKESNPASLTSSPSSEDDLPFDGPKTKVVVRRLPPSLSERAFTDSIPLHFHTLFNWLFFIPGKTRKGNRGCHSCAYLDFKNPEDVFKFMDEFSGHLFVNERGSKCRAVVEYALHQKVPKPFSEEDTQEGSISKDPEYLEFLEDLTKPIKPLPSAEVQLEWKEAERRSSLAAGAHETVKVTPLMEYVRRKRGLQAECSANAVKRHEKQTYVPRPRHEANQVKEVPKDKKRAAGEVQGGERMPERHFDRTVQKSGGSRQSGEFGQARKDGKGKKSKQSNGHQKRVWVAKPRLGS